MVIYVFEIDEGHMERGQANKSDAQSILKRSLQSLMAAAFLHRDVS